MTKSNKASDKTEELKPCPFCEKGDEIPSGMQKISKFIATLQDTFEKFGDTCVYIRPGVSWGAVAMNRRDDDEKDISDCVETFTSGLKDKYQGTARDILRHAIRQGWTKQTRHSPVTTEDARQALDALKNLCYIYKIYDDSLSVETIRRALKELI